MTNPRRYIGDSTTNSWGGPAPGVPRDYNFSIYIINNFCEISKKNMAALCPCPKSLPKDKLQNNG